MKLAGLLAIGLTWSAFAASEIDWPGINLVQVTDGLLAPTAITHAKDGSGRLFITEQAGTVRILQGTNLLATPFLSITDRVVVSYEQGLLGIAFPPSFSAKRYFYVNYTRRPDGATVVSRFHVSANDNIADAASEQAVLLVPQPFSRHNGGSLVFGPDGYLYIGMGDGGGTGDPAQDPQSLLGKMLRIDAEGATHGYLIPPTNPFRTNAVFLPEIWALGLRNPWQFSFDRMTGDLYIADVGEARREEVDFQPASSPGGENYGWPIQEGTSDHSLPAGLDLNLLTMPVFDYGPGPGPAIIGGHVYRGTNFPRMQGIYFFGDFGQPGMWGLKFDGGAWQVARVLEENPFAPRIYRPSAFGEDEEDELFVTSYSPYNVGSFSSSILHVEDDGRCHPPRFEWTNTAYAPDVRVSSLTPRCRIHYTFEDREPTENDPSIGSGEGLPVILGQTNRARAFRSDLLPSQTAQARFSSFQVATPTLSASFEGTGVVVSASCITPGATLFYTTNGSGPTTNSSVYEGPFSSTPSSLVSVAGFRDGYSSSQYGELTRAVARSMTFTNDHLEVVAWLPKAAAYWLEASSDLRVWRLQGSTRIGPALAASFSYTGVASNYLGEQFFRIGGRDGLPPGLP